MKLKYSVFILLATVVAAFTACSDDEDKKEQAVGIVSGTITPMGSTVSYKLVPKDNATIENTNDSLAWDVTESALSEAVLKVTPTLETTVSYNGKEVGADGVTVNANNPVTLQVKGSSGKTVTYKLNVVRAKNLKEGLVKKSSAMPGAVNGAVWQDVVSFKGKFYALVVSAKATGEKKGEGEEHYQLFSSINGIDWQEVNYAVLPKQDVIGGEGARLVVFSDKLYVLGGIRTLGADKYGIPAEIEDGWMGPAPVIKVWRGYVTSDGTNFESLAEKLKVEDEGKAVEAENTWLYNNPYCSYAILNGKIFQHGGFTMFMGMAQGASNTLESSNGYEWKVISTLDDQGKTIYLPSIGANFFSFKGKLYIVGGFTNFIDAKFMNNAVYSSTDGKVWKKEAENVEGFSNLYQATVVATDNVVYIMGGEIFKEDKTRVLNTKVYRSTDCIHWTEVSAEGFTGVRYAAGVVAGQGAWFFGGYESVSTGNYAFPQQPFKWSNTTWNAAMK